ncbi:MAG: 4Fe-4S ferredoxin [Clostridiales bacterium]|jgi:ferredoxin|nr:4Fe-4S ferredoxin [Clostridiales bacterium]
MDLNFLNDFLQRISILKIDETSCLKVISPKSTCNKCREVCPQGAITLGERVNVTEGCNNCGACVAVCPTGVFSISDPSDEYLLERAGSSKKMALTCAKYATRLPRKVRNSAIKVECLSRLSFESLLALGVAVEDKLYLYCDEKCCSDCNNKKTVQYLQSEIYKANSLLGGSKSICWTKDFPQDAFQKRPKDYKGFDNTRRQFFKEIGAGVKKLPFEALYYMLNGENEIPRNNYNQVKETKGLPFKRQLLLESLQKAMDKRGIEGQKLKLPLYKLKIDNCYLCGICTKLCPYSAIRLSADGNLEINYLRCVNCGLCSDVCNNRAISFHDNVTYEELVGDNWKTIVQSSEKVCKKCGEKFTAGSNNCVELCLRCKIESDMAGGKG